MTDEVLVHISTPATRQNDELFRSLANAYAVFQPHQIYRDGSARKKARSVQSTGYMSDTNAQRVEESVIGEAADVSVLTASKESYGSFPSNLSSDGDHLYQDPTSVNNGSARPISRLAQLDRSYLSWREGANPKPSSRYDQPEPENSSSDPGDTDTGFIGDSQLAVQALQNQLQDTYSTTSEDTSEDGEMRDAIVRNTEKLSPPGVSDENQHNEIIGEAQLSAVSEDNTFADIGKSPLKEHTDMSIHATRTSQTTIQAVLDQLDFSKLPVNAFPPAPTISVARPKSLPSQITKHLAAIKIRNPDRFKPLKMRRIIDNDERGYWLTDCMQWSPNLQWEFWSLLYEHVRSGRIGWGTTLHRETKSGNTLGRVRLYCWGEVAEHMWLLLWFCSKGRASGSGTRWFDASGVAVLEA